MIRMRNAVTGGLIMLQLEACHYRPQRSCGKVMFLHLSVILFTGGGGVCQIPSRRHPPPGQTHPWADTLPGQTPIQQTATAADGMHPTGMHSCFMFVLQLN